MPDRSAGAQLPASFSLRRVRRILCKQLLNVNLLLVCVPLTFIAAALQWHDVVISTVSFLAIIPLSALVSDASDTIGDRWGAIIGGLVNATFGNTVELIVSNIWSANAFLSDSNVEKYRLEYWPYLTMSYVWLSPS